MRGNQLRETGRGEQREAYAERCGYFQSRARQLTSPAFERAIAAFRGISPVSVRRCLWHCVQTAWLRLLKYDV